MSKRFLAVAIDEHTGRRREKIFTAGEWLAARRAADETRKNGDDCEAMRGFAAGLSSGIKPAPHALYVSTDGGPWVVKFTSGLNIATPR